MPQLFCSYFYAVFTIQDEHACYAYKANHTPTITICGEISTTEPRECNAYRLFVQKARESCVNFLIGGPPCQGMSSANAHADTRDKRNKNMLTFVELAQEINAIGFVMEEVPT